MVLLGELAKEPVWSPISSVSLAKQVMTSNESRGIPTTESWVSWEAPEQVEFPRPWG